MIILHLAAVASMSTLLAPEEPSPEEEDVRKWEEVRIGGDDRQSYFIHRPGEASGHARAGTRPRRT